MSARVRRTAVERQKAPRRRGSALLLTMFTVAALLTLGTTFIAISIGESKQTRGDKDSQLARSVALYGINWVTSYMALPTAWGSDNTRDASIGSADKVYKLRATDTNSNLVSWLNRSLDYQDNTSTFSDGTFQWRLGILKAHGGGDFTGTQVALPTEGLVGVFDLTIEKLSADKAGQTYLRGQPTQYAITSTGYVFRQSDATSIYNTTTTPYSVNVNKAVAVRQITMRVKPQNPFDFAIYEANMRSWNIPGFNTQFGQNNRADNGMGIIDPNQYTAGSQKQKDAQLQLQLLQNMYEQVQLDSVGIPTNYTMKGNFRADGSITPGDPFASVSGTIHVFATNESELSTIKFTGKQTSFVQGGTNAYDGSFSNTQKSSIFTGPNGASFDASRGLPAVADYMTSYVADTSSWPTPNPADPTSSNQTVTTAPISKANGWAATLAQGTAASPGYVKVATPASGAVPVTSSTTIGADVEIQDPNNGGPAIQQPGFAKVKISFSGTKVTVQKVGAYSGKPVNTTDPPFDRAYDVTEFPKGLLYVDGGNVEIQGQVPGNLTVVAAASSDRPTVATPAKRDGSGNLVPQAGLPVLITPDQQNALSQSTGIYRSGDDAIFHKDSNGQITNIPAFDSATQKWYFPAYDPKKIGEQAGNPAAVTSEAPLVREGNVVITGDLKKPAGGSGALGIVAQNYVLLSDQSADTTKNSLQIDGVLMSMQRSVQYGGFMTAEGSGTNSYFQAMGVNPDGSGNVKGSLARPRHQVNNGSFTLNGSIIGQYADVESSKTGVGYSTQTINQDAGLRSAAPPLFPNFARDQQQAKVIWVVVAVSDSSSLKSGTVANGQ